MSRTIAGNESNDELYTPQFVLDWLGPIDLDPCWDERSLVRPNFYMTADMNGLAYRWDVSGLVFVNMPYSDQARWIEKCAKEAKEGRRVIALVQAKPGERVWMQYVWPTASIVAFLKGRLTFVRADGEKSQSATFNSALVGWNLGDSWHEIRDRATGHKHEPVWVRTV